MTDTPISRVPEVIDFLLDNLPDVVRPVQVSEGWPGRAVEQEHVSIMDAHTELEHRLQNRVRPPKEENGVLNLWVSVASKGGTATEVRRRAYEIAGLIDTWLRRDGQQSMTLGGAVCWAYVARTDWTPGISDEARDGVLEIALNLSEMRL